VKSGSFDRSHGKYVIWPFLALSRQRPHGVPSSGHCCVSVISLIICATPDNLLDLFARRIASKPLSSSSYDFYPERLAASVDLADGHLYCAARSAIVLRLDGMTLQERPLFSGWVDSSALTSAPEDEHYSSADFAGEARR
jgi:hypothetical protein